MALINKVLPGYVATIWCQTGANPTAFTEEELNTWADVESIIGPSAGGTATTAAIQIPVEAVPAFGSDDAFAAYSVAGQRTGAKITTQNQVTSLTITCPWNPADPAQLLMRDDGYNGTIIRTYVIAVLIIVGYFGWPYLITLFHSLRMMAKGIPIIGRIIP